MNANEDTLLQRAVAGEQEALAALLECCASTLRNRLAPAMPARWRHAFDLDDVLQHTFADALLSITSLEPRGMDAFTAWLVTLGRHNILNAIRGLEADKRGGGRARLGGAMQAGADDSCVNLLDQLGAETRTASRAVARQEAVASLLQAIEMLPDAHRTAVLLYDIECRPMDSVAAALARSPGAVHMLRARAHRLLAERLGTASRYLSR